MANLRIETFANVANNTDLLAKYPNANINSLSTSYSIGGRTGARFGSGLAEYIADNIPGNAGVVIGALINFNSYQWVATKFLQIDDGTSTPMYLQYDTSNILSAYSPSNTLLGSSGAITNFNSFHYIEIKTTPSSGSSGTVVVSVDGTIVINVSGVKTTNSNATFASWGLSGNGGGGATFYGSDIYVNDLTGSVNNGMLGPMKGLISRLTANGDTNNFTIGGSSPAGTNWQNINQTTPTYASNFNYDTTVNDLDLYDISTPSGLFSVNALQITGVIDKTDAGTRTCCLITKIGGTTYQSATITLSSSFLYYRWNFDVNPNTSAAWSTGDLASMQVGLKILS